MEGKHIAWCKRSFSTLFFIEFFLNLHFSFQCEIPSEKKFMKTRKAIRGETWMSQGISGLHVACLTASLYVTIYLISGLALVFPFSLLLQSPTEDDLNLKQASAHYKASSCPFCIWCPRVAAIIPHWARSFGIYRSYSPTLWGSTAEKAFHLRACSCWTAETKISSICTCETQRALRLSAFYRHGKSPRAAPQWLAPEHTCVQEVWASSFRAFPEEESSIWSEHRSVQTGTLLWHWAAQCIWGKPARNSE